MNNETIDEAEKSSKEAIEKTIKRVFGKDMNVEIKITDKDEDKDEAEDKTETENKISSEIAEEIAETKKLMRQERFEQTMLPLTGALLSTIDMMIETEGRARMKKLNPVLIGLLVSVERKGLIKIIRK